MTDNREALYDEKIAPELLRIAKLAEECGISLIAMAEWEPGETGHTASLQANASFAVRMAQTAMRASGNVDSMMFALADYARENGHGSIVLRMMGVDTAARPKAEAGQ